MRTGRPRTVDHYAVKRDALFDGFDKALEQQRRRVLQRLYGRREEAVEPDPDALTRRRRREVLGPALHIVETKRDMVLVEVRR